MLFVKRQRGVFSVNEKIKQEMRRRGIPTWKLAQAWGCAELTVYRRVRVELTPEQRAEVMGLLRQMSEGDAR